MSVSTFAPMAERLVEAARYALLRRLAPALRHNMAGSLQPIAMMAALLEKRLLKPSPDLQTLAKYSSSLGTTSREASALCMSLMSWMTPKNNDLTELGTGLAEAVALVTTELSFRGFNLVNETQGVQAKVAPGVVRDVFIAALIALTDTAVAPADVRVTTAASDGQLLIEIAIVQTQGEALPGAISSYRDLQWPDVQVLADAESVVLTHTAERAELRCQPA